ncbi:DUF5057 domain-containing protein [Paenibacillus glufosinatiresistens]|uniref:DUF5057 domain-containing protein n=1 Tax=Paenibacillus glufosinatiresistens TaxID=3070657 RepID=UPI00286E0A18|nr:DUF5057 domain-containing protein [Paenibacillus sp. YX.27]
MKWFKRRKLVALGGAALAILLAVLLTQGLSMSVDATNSYTIRILEITDPNSASLTKDKTDSASELDALKKLPNVKVDTVTMKKFVSLREAWDGKYDAVYIGFGDFTKTAVNSNGSMSTDGRNKAHNTTAVENDITALKAKEITDYYINRGLYVFFRGETFDAQKADASKQGILYRTFGSYYLGTANRPNVVFLKEADLGPLASGISDSSSPYLAGLTQRPRIDIANKSEIKSYLTSPDFVYNAGDKLNFSINLTNTPNLSSRPVRVQLYMNVDSSLPLTSGSVVASAVMKSQTGTLSYSLPATYSGPLYWRLEATDTTTGLKDYDSGVIRFRGLKPVVRVLQVMPAGLTESSLLNTGNMKTAYLSNEDYELQITVKDMSAFNSYIASRVSPADPTSGLNGTYDMVVFGFRDMYDRVKTPMISEAAAKAVKAFAEQTKQSIMLTHDTIFNDPAQPTKESNGGVNYWSYYFHDLVGQDMPRTYLGGSAVATSKTVVPVNDGLLTQYPFNLASVELPSNQSRYAVALTHDQFFPLNLERTDVIPWYNISGSSRDTNDSRNHFYTYSVGNITFSGTGHTSSGFPDWEQKLFVNTMYRAFVGANHAPEITVNSPTDGSTMPSYLDKLLVDFSAKDYDLNDRDLTASISVNYLDPATNKFVTASSVKNVSFISGQTVSRYFENPLPVEDGTLQIVIQVKDSHGALAAQTVTVKVKEATASLTATRSLPADLVNNEVERGKETTITYSIIPKPIAFSDSGIAAASIGDKQLISNVVFKDSIPAYLKIVGTSTELNQTGSPEAGYSISKKLSDIRYTLTSENGVKVFTPDPGQEVRFTVTVSPQRADEGFNNYKLGAASLSFDELHAATAASPLGAAADYNLLAVSGSIASSGNLQSEGRIAARGDIDFSSGGGSFNTAGAPSQNGVIAGENLYYNNNIRINGNAVYGGSFISSTTTPSITGKTVNASPVDFTALKENMLNLSAQLAGLPVNGRTESAYGTIRLTGIDGAKTYVFQVSAQDLSSATSVVVDVPSGSTVVVNIGGDLSDVRMALDTRLTGVAAGQILYNFPSAAALTLRNELRGTILAPQAAVSFDNGQIRGQIIAGSVAAVSSAQLYSVPFTGTIDMGTQATPGSVQFTPQELTLTAVVKVTSVSLNDTTILLNDSPQDLGEIILPQDATNKNLRWTSDKPDVVYVDPMTGDVTGRKLGSAVITATATDRSNPATASATVTVKDRALSITGGDGVYKPNDSVALTALYDSVFERNIQYTWKVLDPSGKEVNGYIRTAAGNTATFSAPSSGIYTVQVVVTSEKNLIGLSASKTITVANPPTKLTIEGASTVLMNNSLALNVKAEPADADAPSLEWSLVGKDDSRYASVQSSGGLLGTLTAGRTPGRTVQVVVRDTRSQISSAPFPVRITGLTGLQFSSDKVERFVGETCTLSSLLWTLPSTVPIESVMDQLTWTSNNPAVASFASPVTADNRSIITGNKKGTATVTVTYSAPGMADITATLEVVIKARPVQSNTGDRY